MRRPLSRPKGAGSAVIWDLLTFEHLMTRARSSTSSIGRASAADRAGGLRDHGRVAVGAGDPHDPSLIDLWLAIGADQAASWCMGALVLIWRSFCEFLRGDHPDQRRTSSVLPSVERRSASGRPASLHPAAQMGAFPPLGALARGAHAHFVELGVLTPVGFLDLGHPGALGDLLVLLLLFEGLGERVAGPALLGLDGVDILAMDGGLADLPGPRRVADRQVPAGLGVPGRRAWSPQPTPSASSTAAPAGSRRRRGAW